MHVFDSCSQIIKKVYSDRKTFVEALKDVIFKDEYNKNHFGLIAKICSNELRHHLFLEYLLSTKAEVNLKDSNKYFVLIALANLLFSKDFTYEEVQECLKKKCSPTEFKKLDPYFRYNGELGKLLDNVKSGAGSKEFLSIKYNAPIWFIKLVVGNFGASMSQKILKRNVQPNWVCLSVNTKETSLKKIISTYPNDFSDFKEVDGTVLYKGKKDYTAHEAYQNGLVFPLKMGVKKLIKDLNFKNPKRVTAYVYDSSYVALEIFLKYYSPKTKLTIIYPGGDKFKYFENYLKKHECSNLNLIKSKDPIDKCVKEKQDIVIVNPQSSSFDLIKEKVDFFNTFDEEDLEKLPEEQMKRLIEAKNITDHEGKIVYFVNTIHKEEGSLLINEFKKLDNQIIDKDEKTRFSFEIFDTSMYYAILTKA